MVKAEKRKSLKKLKKSISKHKNVNKLSYNKTSKKRSRTKTIKKETSRKKKSTYKKKIVKNKYKIQFGGENINNQVAIGTAFTVMSDRKPLKDDEIILKKDDIIYIISSPTGQWWLGISRNAVEKALMAKKSKQDIHEVIIQLIDYFYKNPSELKQSLFGELLGWFPVNFVTLYTPKKSVLKSLMTMFDKKSKQKKIELPASSATILESHEISPSPRPLSPVLKGPYVKRKLSYIPKRKLK